MDKQFIKDNTFLLVANIVGGALAYLFHFYAGRTLGPASYGEIGALLSIAYILSVFIYTIQITIANFTSNQVKENKLGEMSDMLNRSLFYLTIFGLIGSLSMFFFAQDISGFLNISSINSVRVFSLVFLFSVLLPVLRGNIQGLHLFKILGINYILEGITKVIAGVVLIYWGFGTFGASIAIIASYLSGIFYSLWVVRKIILKPERKQFSFYPLFKYCFYVFLGILFLTLLYSIDILIVKHFIEPSQAGLYVALSTMGKLIYFACMPISQILFPKAVHFHKNISGSISLLIKSLFATSAICLPSIALFYLAPSVFIKFLYGISYYPIIPLMAKMAVFASIYSFIYLLIIFSLAVYFYVPLIILAAGLGIELLLLGFYHASLLEIINVLLYTAGVMLFSLFVVLFAWCIYTCKQKSIVDIRLSLKKSP